MRPKSGESLFENLDELNNWHEHWQGMPEFVQGNEDPFQSILIHFRNEQDRKEFEELIGQRFTYKTKSAWFPEYDREKPSNYLYINEINLSAKDGKL